MLLASAHLGRHPRLPLPHRAAGETWSPGEKHTGPALLGRVRAVGGALPLPRRLGVVTKLPAETPCCGWTGRAGRTTLL